MVSVLWGCSVCDRFRILYVLSVFHWPRRRTYLLCLMARRVQRGTPRRQYPGLSWRSCHIIHHTSYIIYHAHGIPVVLSYLVSCRCFGLLLCEKLFKNLCFLSFYASTGWPCPLLFILRWFRRLRYELFFGISVVLAGLPITLFKGFSPFFGTIGTRAGFEANRTPEGRLVYTKWVPRFIKTPREELKRALLTAQCFSLQCEIWRF